MPHTRWQFAFWKMKRSNRRVFNGNRENTPHIDDVWNQDIKHICSITYINTNTHTHTFSQTYKIIHTQCPDFLKWKGILKCAKIWCDYLQYEDLLCETGLLYKCTIHSREHLIFRRLLESNTYMHKILDLNVT